MKRFCAFKRRRLEWPGEELKHGQRNEDPA